MKLHRRQEICVILHQTGVQAKVSQRKERKMTSLEKVWNKHPYPRLLTEGIFKVRALSDTHLFWLSSHWVTKPGKLKLQGR